MKPLEILFSGYLTEFFPLSEHSEQMMTVQTGKDLSVAKTPSRCALILHGGEDISPTIYEEKVARQTGAKGYLSARDQIEINLAKAAIKLGMPIFGICRGAQLMCALSGGKLVQHVTRHHGDHALETYDGLQFKTNSVHHQMMYPWYVEHDLLGWTFGQSDVYIGGSGEHMEFPEHAHTSDGEVIEPEIVWFPKTNAFCVQGHPEWTRTDPDLFTFRKYVCEEFLTKVIDREAA